MRLDGKCVLLLATDPVFRRDVLSGDSHMPVTEWIVERGRHRIDHHPIAHALTPTCRGQEVSRATHAFGPRANHDIGITKEDVLSGRNDRLQSAAA